MSIFQGMTVPRGDPPRPVQLLVVDDHTLLRGALCEILRREPGLEVVAEAGDGEEGVRLAIEHRPDLVLLDVEMPGQPATATVRQLREYVPAAKILILSMHDDEALIHELLALGACAFLHKSAARETLLSALRLVATSDQQLVISVPHQHGAVRLPDPHPTGRWPGAPVPPWPTQRGPAPAAQPLLSARELEVLAHVETALSNRQIGLRLGITESTVKRHLRNIFGKLDAVSRIDAVNKAKRVGLNPPYPPEEGSGRATEAPTSSPRP